MLLVNVCIAGGVVYAGIKTFVKRRPRKNMVWLVEWNRLSSVDDRSAADANHLILSESELRHYFTVASVALGFSASGALFYPPLGVASALLTIYTSIPMFEMSYVALLREGRVNGTVVSSTTIIAALATRHYVLADVVNWLGYCMVMMSHRLQRLNRLFMLELERSYRHFRDRFHGAPPHSVWVQAHGIEMEIPIEALRVGDTVVVSGGDVIPVAGIIVEGTAAVRSVELTGSSQPVHKEPGDRVVAATHVLTGRLCIRVDNV